MGVEVCWQDHQRGLRRMFHMLGGISPPPLCSKRGGGSVVTMDRYFVLGLAGWMTELRLDTKKL